MVYQGRARGVPSAKVMWRGGRAEVCASLGDVFSKVGLIAVSAIAGLDAAPSLCSCAPSEMGPFIPDGG